MPLFESYGWRFIARLLYLMRDQRGYEAPYAKLLAFTETNIWDKWYARGVTTNMYRVNTHMASHWAYIGLFLGGYPAAARRTQCMTVASNISHQGMPNHQGRSLRTQLIDSPVLAGASFWNTDWGSTSRPGSDVNHGEAVVNFCVEAHQLGVPAWTAADMTRLVKLLSGVIWPRSGGGAGYVDGSGTGNGWFHGYAKLGRFDVALHKRLEGHATGNNSIWHIGNMAASARRLRGKVD